MATAMEVHVEWVCDRVLAAGSFGSVELWRSKRTQEAIAIKRCRWDDAQLTEKQKERWIKEVQIMAGLNHPNIIATRPAANEFKKEKDVLPVLCMEYCSKGDLRAVLKRSENCCGVSEAEAIKIMSHVSSAVEYLHYLKITHRDLKPDNIVLQEKNGQTIYKLIDLGFAKELGQQSICASIVGTLSYLAPELMWKKTYSCSVDYWSLGILFYEVLTGTRPFLPNMPHTLEWMKHISQKSYRDICAHEIDGEVVFGTDVEGPTDISQCFRTEIVKWFRIVFQWDPKRRGTITDGERKQEVIVFSMLKKILSKKMIYVFCVPLYRIFTFNVTEDATLEMLQSLIEKDTGILVEEQILTNSIGEILNVNSLRMLKQLQDPCITLFKKGSILVETLSEPDVSVLVLKMLEQARSLIDYQVLKRYYSAAMFFFKQELKLFQSYILAVSMKIDLVNARLNMLTVNVKKMLHGTHSLKPEAASMSSWLEENTMVDEWRKAFDAVLIKIEKLSDTANQIEAKCTILLQRGERLMSFAETGWSENFQTFFDEALNIFESLEEDSSRKKSQPNKMTRLVFTFLQQREAQINVPKIADIDRIISQLEEELPNLEEAINSATALTEIYHKELLNLQQKRQNEEHAAVKASHGGVEKTTTSSDDRLSSLLTSSVNGSLNTNDKVIYDNLVLRHMMEDFITVMQEKYREMINLN